MAIFHSYVTNYQRVNMRNWWTNGISDGYISYNGTISHDNYNFYTIIAIMVL